MMKAFYPDDGGIFGTNLKGVFFPPFFLPHQCRQLPTPLSLAFPPPPKNTM